MELVVLGCSGSVPGADAPASGYFLHSPQGIDLVMDVGPGVLAAMQRHPDIEPSECHILLSHMHADHCMDIPSLLVWRRYHPEKAATSRHMFIGPTIATANLGAASADAPERPDDMSDTFDVHIPEVGPAGPFDAASWPHIALGDLKIYSVVAVHPTESYITRLEDADGNSLVYSGDTASTPDLARISAGADVLICEATWGDGAATFPEGMHLSGAEAGQAAQEAGVGKLILTHIPPWGDAEATLNAARLYFDGPIEVAYPNMRLTIGN